MSTPSSIPPHYRGSSSRLAVLILGPLVTFYALCWLIAVVEIQIKVQLALPADAMPATARASLHFEHGAAQSIERPPPLSNPLILEFEGGIASLRHFLERVDDPSVTVEAGNCKPVELPIACGPWTIQGPNYFVVGSWSARFARECSARGKLSCPAAQAE